MLSETDYMPWDWPVEVNCFEANAYCCWLADKTGKPFRLMSEDEYYLLLKSIDFDWETDSANIALKYASPCPVNLHRTGKIYDAIGNVWQWTRTPMYPFEGFKCHPSYDDFTIPTFDDRHNLFKGGAWVSCGNLAT
jgi:formylglycine-generating enzyme required for sulfatase activity